MSIMNILDLPEECLLMVFMEMDLRSQCNFAFTCCRFQAIYYMVHKKHFRNFVWYERTNLWSHLEIQSFFKLNGYKMEMLSLTDVRDYDTEVPLRKTVERDNVLDHQEVQKEQIKKQNMDEIREIKHLVVEPLHKKTIYVAHICVYLKNLRSLILTIDHKLGEIVIEICRHMRQLQDLTISSAQHPNYEFLALLPHLQNLDIEYFAMDSDDKLFETLAKIRPSVMQTLRIGSELKLKQFEYICQLSCLKMLNINNPSSIVLVYLHRMENLSILSLTDAVQLDNIDFIRLLCGIKRLNTLYVSYCMKLSNDFVFFAIKYLHQEAEVTYSLRRLPFYLECHRTAVVHDINKYEVVSSALSLIQINFKNNLPLCPSA